MNTTEVSGLACAGLHDTSAGEQSYATECPEMNQDPFHETTNFEASMETPAKHSNSNTCLDGNQHTVIMAGIVQAAEEVKFGSMQHLEGRVSDSDEESLSSSPKTSSTSNYGYMEQPFQNYYNTLDEMDDKDGLVMLNPEFVLCDMDLHLQPHLTFSSDGFKIEHFDCDSREDDKMVALYSNVCDIISINSKWTQTVDSASITLMVRPSGSRNFAGHSGLFIVSQIQHAFLVPRINYIYGAHI